MAKRKSIEPASIYERLRQRRVEVLDKSVRDIAKLLDTSPIHISDIETGKRTPSEELLLRMVKVYGIPEADLRAGFSRPEAIVAELATDTPVAVEKVPEFLRTTRGWTNEQWDKMIKLAKKANEGEGT
ncbi:MAG: helix-turn-helix transcriptional regulator [Phycisphaerales bacterium]|jgi:transcriptional regulator with XRE-family HTH domain